MGSGRDFIFENRRGAIVSLIYTLCLTGFSAFASVAVVVIGFHSGGHQTRSSKFLELLLLCFDEMVSAQTSISRYPLYSPALRAIRYQALRGRGRVLPQCVQAHPRIPSRCPTPHPPLLPIPRGLSHESPGPSSTNLSSAESE